MLDGPVEVMEDGENIFRDQRFYTFRTRPGLMSSHILQGHFTHWPDSLALVKPRLDEPLSLNNERQSRQICPAPGTLNPHAKSVCLPLELPGMQLSMPEWEWAEDVHWVGHPQSLRWVFSSGSSPVPVCLFFKVHTFNPSTLEPEAAGGQPGVCTRPDTLGSQRRL